MDRRRAQTTNVGSDIKKMKICVIGGGFTGILTALSVKRHLPQSHVTLIDPGNEMKLPGLGLSMPAHTALTINTSLLANPVDTVKDFFDKIMTETNSTVKINLKWHNFRDKLDTGWYSGLNILPAADIINCFSMVTDFVRQDIKRTTDQHYQLPDLWYELFLAGRRKFEDLGPEINHYHWFCEYHRIPDYSIFEKILPTFHANSWDFGQWLKKSFADELDQIIGIDVQSVQLTNDGSVEKVILRSNEPVTADFFIDCTGFRRLLGKTVGSKFIRPPGHVFNDATVVVGQGYSKDIDREMHPYTIGYGMDYGWTFAIPMKHAKSYGYNFESSFISADQALQELEQLAPAHNRIHDPQILRWNPGYFPQSMNANYAMIGISSGFTDPFEAHSVGLQLGQIRKVIAYLLKSQTQDCSALELKLMVEDYNRVTRDSFESVVQRLDFHMCLAPRKTSEYWRRNHALAQQHDMGNKIFDVINDPCHYEPARDQGTYKAYPAQCYLTESFYFGVDMSRRCRNSSSEVLQLADMYFKNFSQMNQLRAQMSQPLRQWYSQYGIDLDQYITLP